jgi:peptide-methionine (R)-S-oxide reductase
MHRYLILLVIVLFACKKSDATQDKGISGTLVKTSAMDTSKKIKRTEKEWKAILTPEQYHVLRKKGTDAPFKGTLTFNKEEGKYFCAGCGNELFTSEMKFESNCGWPSFDKEIEGGKIETKTDTSFGMVRTEILCARCGSHLGHLFDDGPTSTGLRYCVNSTSLQFKKKGQ